MSSNIEPDFFLISGERSDPIVATACWREGRLSDGNRDDYMLVSIDPPIVGQKYGLGATNINNLILSAHLLGVALFPITRWPCFVNVMRIKNEAILKSLLFQAADIEIIGRGSLLPTKEEALAIEQQVIS